jgi:small subunit ribosomal protein S6e
MVFKFVVSEKEKSYQVEKEAEAVVGKKIGDKIDGGLIGLDGYELEITGGTDRDGFPMRPDIETSGRRRIVTTASIGCKLPKGVRKRKTFHGNVISSEMAQINCKVVKVGTKKLEEVLGKKASESEDSEGEKKEDAKEPQKTGDGKPEDKPKEEGDKEKPAEKN